MAPIPSGTKMAMAIKIGVYDTSAIIGTKKFMIITENTPTIPPKPANEPTDFPLNKSLGKVCTFPMAN